MRQRHLLGIAAGLSLIFLAAPAHAQSARAVFNGPQNMDAGLQNGLNNLTGYVAVLPLGAKTLGAKGVAASINPKIECRDGRLPAGANDSDSGACQ